MQQTNTLSPRVATVQALEVLIAQLQQKRTSLEATSQTFFMKVEIGSVSNAISWIRHLHEWFVSHSDAEVRDLNARWITEVILQRRLSTVRSAFPSNEDLAVMSAKNIIHSYVCSMSARDLDCDFERAYLCY